MEICAVRNDVTKRQHGLHCCAGLAIAVASIALLSFAPTTAHAWTEANVRSAQVHVEVDGDGAAHVRMRLSIQVHAGWLQGLEVAGLDRGLELDVEHPPILTSVGGQTYPTDARVHRGNRVALSFGRRHSPRRGDYYLDLNYRVQLDASHFVPNESGEVEIRWSLPPWRSGLDGVELALTVPGEATPSARHDAEASIEFRREINHDESGSPRTTLTWRRVHLPLTLIWEVGARVPEEVMAESFRAPTRLQRPPPPQPTPEPSSLPLGLCLIAVVLVLSLAKRGLFVAEVKSRNPTGLGPVTLRTRPLLPGPEWLRILSLIALGGVAAWFETQHYVPLFQLTTAAFMVLLVAERTATIPQRRRLSGYRFALAEEIEASAATSRRKHLLGLSLLDARAPTGLIFALVVGAGLYFLGRAAHASDAVATAQMAPIIFALFFVTTRRQLPLTVEETLHRLIRFNEQHPELCVEPVVCVDRHERLLDARLRFEIPAVPGLLRADIVLAEERHLGSYYPEAYLLTVSRAESEAEAFLRQKLPGQRTASAPGNRIGRLWKASEDPASEFEWLFLNAPRGDHDDDRDARDSQEEIHDDASATIDELAARTLRDLGTEATLPG